MRILTHQFAHIETLERAKRWLVQAGIDPSRIEARTQGIPTLAVAVEPGESAEVQQIIDAAESSDPDGNPGIWDLARQRHVYPQPRASYRHVRQCGAHRSRSSSGGGPKTPTREVTQTDTEPPERYRDGKD